MNLMNALSSRLLSLSMKAASVPASLRGFRFSVFISRLLDGKRSTLADLDRSLLEALSVKSQPASDIDQCAAGGELVAMLTSKPLDTV